MKKKMKENLEKLFYLLWFIRIPIVSVSILLLINACKLSDMQNIALVCMAVCFMLSGGYIINDILDIEIDRISAPKRPLPSGHISIKFAKKICSVLITVAIVFSLLTKNMMFVVYIVFYEMMFWIYTKFLKRNGLIKNFVTALFFSSIAIVPVLFKNSVFLTVLPLYIVAFIFTLGREILMDVRDVDGDMIIKGRQRIDKMYALFFSTFFLLGSFFVMEIYYFDRCTLRYLVIILLSSIFYIYMRNRKRFIWICTELVKIIFLTNLIFLYI